MNDEDRLRDLLAEILNELCNQAVGSDGDTLDYIDSMIERARELGVSV